MQFIIPTIFTGVDRSMSSVTMQVESSLVGLYRTANRTNGALGGVTQQVLAYAGAASAVGATAAGLILAGKSMLDYQDELNNLHALTGASQQDFTEYKGIIQGVANESRRSAVDVTMAFTEVANNMPQLLQSADGLGKVTSASILLAKAARMELMPAAQSVTTILNQFGKGANDASKLVDMMAAGSKYGSAEITDQADALREFGAQAKLAGINLQESIGLTELVSKFRKGTQAGIELRNVLLYMDTLKVQDPKALNDLNRLGVNMATVTNKALPLSGRLAELGKIANDDAALFHVFGKENLAMAATVLKNNDQLQNLVNSIGEIGVAQQMAAENTSGLRNKVKELGNTFVNYITGAAGSNTAMSMLSSTTVFLTDNLGTLLNIGVPLIGMYASYRTLLGGLKVATNLYNVSLGIYYGLTSTLTVALAENAVAARAETAAIKFRTLATWAGVEASTAMIIASGGLLIAVAGVISYFNIAHDKSEILNRSMSDMDDKFTKVTKPITEATIAMRLYNSEVEKYIAKRDERALYDYNIKNNPISTTITEFLTHPITSLMNQLTYGEMVEPAVNAPNIKDFPGLDISKLKTDTTDSYKPNIPGDTTQNVSYNNTKQQQPVTVNVYVDKDGNQRTEIKNGSGLPQLTQTGNAYTRTT